MSAIAPSRENAPAVATSPPGRLGAVGSRLLTASMILSAVVFIAVTLGTSLIGKTAFYGGGALLNSTPWIVDDYRPVAIDNVYVGDTIDAAIPGRHEIVERVRAGDLPGWTSLQGPGTELFSVPNLGLLAPTAIAWWVLPTDLAPGWERLTILIVACAGTALFLRRLGLGRHSSWLAGMVYATSGFMIAWTNWPQAAVAAMLPWLLWAVERSLQLRSWASVAPVALTVAALLLGGFPALTGWGLYAAGSYALVRVLLSARQDGEARWRGALGQISRLTVGLVLGIGVTAVQLGVFLVQFADLDTTYREGGFQHVQLPRMALTALFPNTWGINGGFAYTETNPVEANAYLGAAAAVLCVVALTVRPGPTAVRGARSYFAALAALCLFLVYVQAPFTDWIGALPVFSNNPIGRLVAIFLLAASVLAGFGAEAVLRPRPQERSGRRRAVTVVLVAASGAVVALLALYAWGQIRPWRDSPELFYLPLGPWLVLSVCCAGLVAGLVLLSHWRPRLATAGFVVVPLLVMTQGLVAAAPVWEQIEAERFYPVTDMHEFLLDNLEHDRMANTGATMGNGTPAYYGLRSATAHIFFTEAASDLTNRIAPEGRISPTFWNLPGSLDLPLWQSPGLDRLAVRFLTVDAETALPGVVVPLVTGTATRPLGREPVEVPLPGGPVRGFSLESVVDPGADSAGYVVAEVVDGSGEILASTRRLVTRPRLDPVIPVPVAGEEIRPSDGPLVLRLSWSGADPAPVVVTDDAGLPAVSVVRPQDDGLRLASDDNGAVWERTTSLPRIRWAGKTRLVADADERADTVTGERLPASTVVLSAEGSPTDGRPAVLDVREDSGDTVTVDVDADGAGYLVLADAVQTDWSVTVDGRDAPIEAADHAFGAVHVPAGRHEVVFTYTPRGQDVGLAVSLASIAVLVAISLPVAVWQRLRRSSRAG